MNFRTLQANHILKFLLVASNKNEIKIMNDNREEIKKSNYEILCIIKETDSEKKDKLIKEIEAIIVPNKVKFSSEVKKLAYTIENLESADYLLLNFEAARSSISLVEDLLKRSFVVRHMTINLDTEKKIKIKKSLKIQKIRKPRKPGFGKFVKQDRPERHDRNDRPERVERQNSSTGYDRNDRHDRHSSSVNIEINAKR
jgi:ribosomal protein S6